MGRIEEAFAFDLWANREWLRILRANAIPLDDYAAHIPSTEVWPDFDAEPSRRLASVFCHIFGAQYRWLVRCAPDLALTAARVEEWQYVLNRAWVETAEGIPADRIIAYRNTSGLQFELPFAKIVGQVLDHGTYHRGQMREIFGNHFPPPHPETGFIHYQLALKAAGTL